MSAKVLVVDDDKLTLEVVRDMLEAGGYKVATLSAPRLIANVIVRERPDLILVDLRMPELSGDLLVEFIHKFELKVPVVLFSAADEATLKEMAIQSGARGYILKSGDRERFLAQVRSFLSPER
ncbi:MAG TPA: response regulator [Polyangia bacterium]|nr:response regulator [Polyangia bacterium]